MHRWHAYAFVTRGLSLEPVYDLKWLTQRPFRAVCGVATLAHSRAMGCAPRLASPPEKASA
ncbi:MAG: hypothetical protein LBV61_01705 [Burkholderiaceae bacterium]|nr:hypothetical protein [Burkholderiaceae bacterium]